MSHKVLRILLITNIEESLRRTREILDSTDLMFELDVAATDLTPILAQKDYEICIVDCVCDGPALISELRRIGLNVPIILFTANSATEVLEAIHQGASDCLVRDHLTAPLLERSICAVIDRAHAMHWQAQYERYYLGLMENASDVIYTHDLDGNFTSINNAGEYLTGYTTEELLTMNLNQIIAPEYLAELQRIVNRMLADRRRAFFETLIVTKDGRRLHVNVNIHLIYKSGAPIGIQGIAREAWSMPSTVAAGERNATTGRV